MTTNDLSTPAAFIDKDGDIWGNRDGRTAEDMAKPCPHLAPFAPLYRAEDLPALVLPEVTDKDADAARASIPRTSLLAADWLRLVCAVRDSMASRMRPPTLADVLPYLPDLGEGRWVKCYDGACLRTHLALSVTGQGSSVVWCFVPADPDADAKAALTAAAGDPNALRALGWKLVREDGER